MKDFLKVMEKDYQSEKFTKTDWVVFGVVVPVVFLIICCAGSVLQ